MCDIEDLELFDLVKSIPKIAELGLRLGYEAADVDGYEDENRKDLTKRKGTYAMLKDWCNTSEASRARLVQILRASRIARAAKKLESGKCPVIDIFLFRAIVASTLFAKN